ncbi:elongation factor G-like protein EF-G2 [Actinomycetota bacterium]
MSVGNRPSGAAGAAPVRNVVLVGPRGAGKTMLVESVLLKTGKITRLGSIADGTTVSDYTDTEKRLGHSVALTVATTEVSDSSITGGEPVTVTMLDTPGHPDFVGELRAGLRGADAALFVVSASDGIDEATRLLWSECSAVGMPRGVVITHLDGPRADFLATVEECRAAFGDGVHPIYAPKGEEMVGLLSATIGQDGNKREASEDELGDYAAMRDEVIEAVITESEDESLLDRYLGGESVGFDTLVDDLEKAIARASFFPVGPANPTTEFGTREVLELITRGFPTPAEHHMPETFSLDGVPQDELVPAADQPLVAQVLKTTSDAYVGRVSIVRVFSGTLSADTQVHISGHLSQFTGLDSDEQWHASHDEDERAGAISTMCGDKLTTVEQAAAGDIVAVAHLTRAETADTISAAEKPVVIAPWRFPHPLLPVALKAASSKDEDKLAKSIGRVQAENPSVMVVTDPQTHQLVMWTMGEQQLELILDGLRTRMGVDVDVEPLKVAMQETVRASANGTGRHVKQSGGHGQFAIAHIVLEPMPEGGGFEFVDEVVGGAVPRQFIPSVEKGVRAQLEKGVTGYPMVDVRVRLVDGKAHSVDSSDAAFQTAGAMALKDAAAAAGVQLLEPVDDVEITIGDDFVGPVMSDLATRRGRLKGSEPAAEEGRTVVRAEVPAFELVRYPTVLRSVAHGSGEFNRTYVRHAPVPASVQERIQNA